MSGGASGAVLVFRHADPMNEAHASFVTYVRETVFGPLRALRESLGSRGALAQRSLPRRRRGRHRSGALVARARAGSRGDRRTRARPVPTVTDVVRRVAERFRAYADLKGIRLDVDVQELEERFADHEQLARGAGDPDGERAALRAGQRPGRDRRALDGAQGQAAAAVLRDGQRAGGAGGAAPGDLRAVVRLESDVARAHGPRPVPDAANSRSRTPVRVWVESKTGKACTFFLRVRPDGVR